VCKHDYSAIAVKLMHVWQQHIVQAEGVCIPVNACFGAKHAVKSLIRTMRV